MKKNNILLVLVAIGTMLVAVTGAAYAYFATTTSYDNNVQVTATMPSLDGTFTCLGNTITLSPTAQEMSQAASASGNQTYSASKNLVVQYNAQSSTNLSCTYDIVYQWVSATYANSTTTSYTLTSGTAKEFTYALSGAKTVAATQIVNSSTTGVQTIASGESISSANAQVTKNYNITVSFVNFKDQVQAHEGKIFKVNFKCANVKC